MKKHPAKLLTACVVGLALVAASCGSDDEPAADTAPPEPAATEPAGDEPAATEPAAADPAACETTDDVSVQLQWFTQAQFAGYYAAQDMGYYEDMCLNVDIVEGGFDITPQVQLANGDVDSQPHGCQRRLRHAKRARTSSTSLRCSNVRARCR